MIVFFQPCLNIHLHHLYTCRYSLGPCEPLLFANAILEDSEKYLSSVRGASTPITMDSTQAGHPAHAESTEPGLANWVDLGHWDGLGAERMHRKHPGCGVKQRVSRWQQRAESKHSAERTNCRDLGEEEAGQCNLFLKFLSPGLLLSCSTFLSQCALVAAGSTPTSHVAQLLPLTSTWTQ